MKTTMWNADLGNGMYKNPILYADYSDPDACRAGEDYFMIASSFCNAPGLPVLHSKDLVNWKVVNYILPKVPEERYDKQCMDVVYGHRQSVTMTEHFLLVFQCQTKVFT